MELVVSFSVDADGVMGGDEEFDLRLGVHTTDSTQRMSVSKGRAIDIIPLKPGTAKGSDGRPMYISTQPVVFSPPNGHRSSGGGDAAEKQKHKAVFPINDPMGELCVALYANSRFDGVSDKPVPRERDPIDFTRGLGQVFIPWHVIIRHLVSDGIARIKSEGLDEESQETGDKQLFPTTTMKQEFSSLVMRDSIAYRIEILKSQRKDTLALELKKLDANELAHKATLYVHVGLLTSDRAKLSLGERIEIIVDFMVDNRPHKDKPRKHGIDKFVDACQRYDNETFNRTKVYQEAMAAYMKQYEQLWAVDKDNTERLLTLPDRVQSNGALIQFRPDVPSMMRFHLPTWAIGEERIPFVQLWFGMMPGMAKNLHEPTIYTEHWLVHLLRIGIKRAHLTEESFIESIAKITYDANTTTPAHFELASLRGTREHNQLNQCIEALSYTVSALSHAARYQGDVATANRRIMERLIKKFTWLADNKKTQDEMFRYDTEDGQTGITSGMESAADCEGVEWVIAMLENLLIQGRVNGNARNGGGRGWSMPLLMAAHAMLSVLADFNHFGAVNGAQLSDAKDHENDEGFVGSSIDTKGAIAGHTYSFGKPMAVLEAQYEKHKDLVMRIVGMDLALILRNHMEKFYAPWVHGNMDTLARVRKVLRSLPAYVNEGTGRQEPLLLPPEHYYGKSEELLKRTASHASELEVLRIWPAPSKSDKADSQAPAAINSKSQQQQLLVPSLGEALPYTFQKRLLLDSRFGVEPQSQCKMERHLSPFYRRVMHAASTKLKRIHPIFDHMIWVSVTRMTYGPVLREVLDPDGDAIPIPMPESLYKSYSETPEQCAVLDQRMRRLLPTDFSFVHLKEEIDAAKLANIQKPELSASPPHQHDSAPQTPFSISRGVSSDFFEQSLCSWQHPTYQPNAFSLARSEATARGFVMESPLSANGQSHKEADEDQTHIVYVNSESALAKVMSANGNTTNRWETLAPGRINVRYTSDEQATRLKDLIASSKGVIHVEVVSERLRDNLPDILSAYFTRRIAFVVDDSKAQSLVVEKPKSQSHMTTVQSEGKHHKHHHHRETVLTDEAVLRAAQKLGVNLEVVPVDRLKRGIEVEMEHGRRNHSKDSRLDVTHDDVVTTARIALAHFRENPGKRDPESGVYIIPDYYHLLDKMEKDQDAMWHRYLKSQINAEKPSVFLTSERRVIPPASEAPLLTLPRYIPISAQHFPTALHTDS